MRRQSLFPTIALSLGMLVGMGCTDQGTNITTPAPEGQALQAPATPSFQHDVIGQVTLGNLIAALNNITVNIDNLQALNDLTVADVRVVNVEDVLNDNNVVAIDVNVLSGDVTVFTM